MCVCMCVCVYVCARVCESYVKGGSIKDVLMC